MVTLAQLIPPAGAYAVGPMVLSALVALCVGAFLTPLARWGRRWAARGGFSRYAFWHVMRVLPIYMRLRAGGDARGDVWAEWQRLKLGRGVTWLTALVGLVLSQLTGNVPAALTGAVILISASVSYLSSSLKAIDYEFAHFIERTPELRGAVERRIAAVIADRERGQIAAQAADRPTGGPAPSVAETVHRREG